ncbi:MAG: hypothetical protein Q9216_005970 [Gyalolechia sp. 2 TL-2023]
MGVFTSGQVHDAPMTMHFFDIYVQYKKDTRAIIRWLLSHQQADHVRPQDLSVRDLLAIADRICTKAVTMPDVIAFHFRQAIAARTYLSKIFRRASKEDAVSAATENHEFFTSSLTKIYTDLCKCCAKPKDDCNHRYCREDCAIPSRTCTNQYGVLDIAGINVELLTLSDEAPCLHDSTADRDKCTDSLSNTTLSTVVDDGLGNIFELYREIHVGIPYNACIKRCLDVVFRGNSHLITAAAVTSAAHTFIENAEHRLATSHQISDPSAILEACLKMPDSLDSSIDTASASKPTSQTTRDLDDCWQAMMDLRHAATNKDDFQEKILKPHAPPQISLRRGPDTSASDAQCRFVLLSNIAQCMSSSRLQNTFIRFGSPVVPELSFFVSREKTSTNCLHCASGLSLLMSSYKAYSFALPTGQSPSSCRIQALRFAQDVMMDVSSVLKHPSMPCRCHGTLAFHLESLKQDLEEYLRTKMFDFYFQSPWVCGAHILEMLHAVHYYGLRLFAYRSYVGSVVHMYNVLRQLHDLAPIPVLEALCEQLAELFFPGGRPKRSFKNSYVRYMGGRLRFHAKAKHQNGCHGLVIPAHAARANAGFSSAGEAKDGRFECGRLSLLWRIKERDWRFDNDAGSHGRNQCQGEEDYITATELESLNDQLASSFASPLPTALINHFPLYLACARIVNNISDAYHGSDVKPGQYCLCSAENLLVAADGCREGKGWRIKKEVRELAEVCARGIQEEFEGKEVGEFVWRNI